MLPPKALEQSTIVVETHAQARREQPRQCSTLLFLQQLSEPISCVENLKCGFSLRSAAEHAKERRKINCGRTGTFARRLCTDGKSARPTHATVFNAPLSGYLFGTPRDIDESRWP